MPELHIDRIFQLLEARLPAGDHLAMSGVLTGVLPHAVQAWLNAAVADRLAADLQAAPHLSRATGTPAARRIGRGVVAALVPQYVIERGDLLLLLRDAVEFVDAFLHRPRRTLEELLLGNAESVAVTLLTSRLSIITEYTYLGIVLSRLLSEKTAADREELRRLIARVDDEVISRHAPEELAQLMAPLFRWYELAGMQGIPVEAALDFLDDKEMTALHEYVENTARILGQSTLCAEEVGTLAGDLARGVALPTPGVTTASSPEGEEPGGPEVEGALTGVDGTAPSPGTPDVTVQAAEQERVAEAPETVSPPRSEVLEGTREEAEQEESSMMPEPEGGSSTGAPEVTGEAAMQDLVAEHAEELEEVTGTPGIGTASSSEVPEGMGQANEQDEIVRGPESGSPPSSGVPEATGQSEEHGEASRAPETGEVPSSGGLEQTGEPALPAASPDVIQEEPPTISVPVAGSLDAQRNPERKLPAMRLPPEPERTQGESAPRLTPSEEKARLQEGYKGTIRRNFALALTSAGLKFGAPAAKPKPPLASEFSEEQRRLLIASLFRNEAAYFDNVVQTLAGLRSWREGARYLTDFLEINRLNPYAKDVLRFTSVVRRWFVGDEEEA